MQCSLYIMKISIIVYIYIYIDFVLKIIKSMCMYISLCFRVRKTLVQLSVP